MRNNKTKTTEQFKRELFKVNPNIEVLGEYEGANIKILLRCKKDGHEWDARPFALKRGKGCPMCAGNIKKTIEQFKKELVNINPNIEVLGEYEGTNIKILLRCKKDGHEWDARPSHLKKGVGCPICAGNIKKTTEQFKQELFNINPNIEVLGEYEGANIKILLRCEKDGHEWETTPYKLINRKQGCPMCAGRHKTHEEWLSEFKLDENIQLLSEYKDSKTKIKCRCKIDGYEWETLPFVLKKSGCVLCNKGFDKPVIQHILSQIKDTDLLSMEPAELFWIIGQGKLPKLFQPLTETNPNSEERLVTLQELQEKLNTLEDDDIVHGLEIGDGRDTTLPEEAKNTEESVIEPQETNATTLPEGRPINDLHNLDNQFYAGMDKETIEALIQFKLRKLWNKTLNEELNINEFKKETGGEYFTEIKTRFFDEYNQVIKFKPNKGYSFPYQPNLMQKLTVHRLLNNQYYANLSGTGAGKTLSFILASRKMDARLTVVVAINSTVVQLGNDILNVYPDSIIHTSLNESYDLTKHNYLILNYEKFQQEYSEKVFQEFTKNNKIDFVVFDEVHNIKQRQVDEESIRRGVLTRMMGRIRKANPNTKVLIMSATPVVNNLQEAVSLLQLLTGLKYDDLKTSRSIANALKIFQQFTINGLRFIPKYDLNISELSGDNMSNLNIDGTKLMDKLLEIKPDQYIEVEKLILPLKLESIVPYLRKGVILYSYYTTGFINVIQKFVEKQGYKVTTFTGEEDIKVRETNLKLFMSGKIDILIGSKPIGTGVDGLQKVSNRMIALTLPYTSAEKEQLEGRIYRQGSIFKDVELIIPQVIIPTDEGTWSWDKQRLNLIKHKRTLADVAVDGIIPEGRIPSLTALLKKAQNSLKSFKDRIDNGKEISFEREAIDIDLFPKLSENSREKRINSELQEFNRKGKITHSSKMFKEFSSNPSSWYHYHALRKSRINSWSEIPYEYIATKINDKNDIVVDFGCGENLFRTLPTVKNNKIYSFDHVAINDTVTSCDMRNTGLKDKSVHITMFSLSLWGSNFKDYIEEAYRILKNRGEIYIAEPLTSYETEEDIEKLTNILSKIGFKNIMTEKRNKFIYFNAIKK